MTQKIILDSPVMENIFYMFLIFLLLAAVISLLLVIINYKKRVKSEMLVRQELTQKKDEIIDITEKKEKIEKNYNEICEHYEELNKTKDRLFTLAYTDALTNLPNLYSAIEKIESSFATVRKDEKFVLIYIDIDDFKKVVERIGYSYGDELLLDISHRIREAVDENDFLSRCTSDEFIIFSQNIDEIAEYDEKVKRIQKVFSYPFMVSSKQVSVTVSMGLALGPDNIKNAKQFISNASLAMYEAKKKGKNTYCYYTEEISERISKEVLIQSHLTKAISENEFVMYLQPVINIGPKDFNIYEALARWNHEDDGLLLPQAFIETAKRTGQIADIDEIMLKNACHFIKEMQLKCNENVIVSVNLSSKLAFANDFISRIHDVLSQSGITGDKIIFEMKEKDISMNYARYSEVIKKLDSIGIRVCIDNFGLGVASLKELCELPVYMVKIDKSILDGAMFDAKEKNMMLSILRCCELSGIKCVMEGVEQEEQRVYVSELDFYGIQGFYMGLPKEYKEYLE